MKVVWDDRKREANLKTRQMDFLAVRERFDFTQALIESTYPGRGGRARFMAIGPLDGMTVAVIFATLGTEALSVISLRRANRKERKRYDEA